MIMFLVIATMFKKSKQGKVVAVNFCPASKVFQRRIDPRWRRKVFLKG